MRPERIDPDDPYAMTRLLARVRRVEDLLLGALGAAAGALLVVGTFAAYVRGWDDGQEGSMMSVVGLGIDAAEFGGAEGWFFAVAFLGLAALALLTAVEAFRYLSPDAELAPRRHRWWGWLLVAGVGGAALFLAVGAANAREGSTGVDVGPGLWFLMAGTGAWWVLVLAAERIRSGRPH